MDKGIQQYNPIQGVRPHDESGAAPFTTIPVPSTFQWELQDLSENGAGRTEDNVMVKKRSGQLVKVTLTWKLVSAEDAAKILQAFNPEYFDVKYLSPFHGKVVTAEFYAGDRKAIPFNTKRGVWNSISFSITERRADLKDV